jgi:hypothetical protein
LLNLRWRERKCYRKMHSLSRSFRCTPSYNKGCAASRRFSLIFCPIRRITKPPTKSQIHAFMYDYEAKRNRTPDEGIAKCESNR